MPVTGNSRIVLETGGGQSLTLAIEFLAGIWVSGTVGQSFRIEYAEALSPTDWKRAVTLVLQQSPQLWVDADSPKRPRRFYRAVSIP